MFGRVGWVGGAAEMRARARADETEGGSEKREGALCEKARAHEVGAHVARLNKGLWSGEGTRLVAIQLVCAARQEEEGALRMRRAPKMDGADQAREAVRSCQSVKTNTSSCWA